MKDYLSKLLNLILPFDSNDANAQLTALDNALAIIEFTPDGKILRANQNFLTTMGYNEAEIVSKHHSIFVPDTERNTQEYKAFWVELSQGKFKQGEFYRLGKNAQGVWIQATYNPIKDERGKVQKVIKFASDITAQKRQNMEYQEQINAISRAQAVIHFAIDGTIQWANNNFLQAMGYSLEEIKGKHHRIFVEPNYANSEEYGQFWHKLGKGEFASAEYRRFGKGGKEVWIQATYNPIRDETGKPVKVVKYATDITRQKQQNADYQGQLKAISLSQAVIEFDLDGHVLKANDNFLSAMGYQLNEIQGKHHRIFVSKQDQQSSAYETFWKELKAGHFQSGEYHRLNKLGKDVYIQASYNPIFNANGNPVKIVKYATDITKQKLKNADYEGQISAIGKSQAVIEFDMDGTIIHANPVFLSAMGYKLQEIVGKHHRMFVATGEASKNEYQQFWQKLNQGEFQAGEFKRITKSGQDIWIQASYNPIFDLNGKPIKVVKYATDITEQKLQNANYQGQIEAIRKAQAVIEFDMDGTIQTANQHFLDAMGYTLDEIQGKHHSLFVTPELKNSQDYKAFWKRLNEGNFEADEYERIGKGGRSVFIQATYNPILNADGVPYKVVKFCTDITGRVRAIEATSKALQSLSEGQLDCAINIEFIDQFQELKDAINSTLKKLRDTVEEINLSADTVASAANEIRLGNEDLSARTEQQASSLEETAASMEELTSAVRENASLSKEVSIEAEQTMQKAQDGTEVVNKAVKSMTEINQASKKINDIIGVIDEIAFQTNLLALNAAVEAARAGEDGRGFSVVANEVRSLAQRSAGAAKEIKTLITSTVSKVDEGSQLVEESGKTLVDIQAAVTNVSHMISQISAASNEQSRGILEANEAITSMDNMTQQNAALVEEATAASQSLTDQANKMKALLAFFKLNR